MHRLMARQVGSGAVTGQQCSPGASSLSHGCAAVAWHPIPMRAPAQAAQTRALALSLPLMVTFTRWALRK